MLCSVMEAVTLNRDSSGTCAIDASAMLTGKQESAGLAGADIYKTYNSQVYFSLARPDRPLKRQGLEIGLPLQVDGERGRKAYLRLDPGYFDTTLDD